MCEVSQKAWTQCCPAQSHTALRGHLVEAASSSPQNQFPKNSSPKTAHPQPIGLLLVWGWQQWEAEGRWGEVAGVQGECDREQNLQKAHDEL